MPGRAARIASFVVAALVATGCSLTDSAVTVLADLEGWDAGVRRLHQANEGAETARLELAYDAAAAEELWAAAGPAGPGGRQAREGRGSRALAEVDFDRHVVALWSSFQAAGCPETVRTVRRSGNLVVVTTALDRARPEAERRCGDDYRPYREVVLVDRTQVPASTDLDRAEAEVRDESSQDGGQRVRLADFADRP